MARYFGIDEANERLRELRPLLEQLRADRDRVAEIQHEPLTGTRDERQRRARRTASPSSRRSCRRSSTACSTRSARSTLGRHLRDISSGLIDFPALANGRPIWLCWRLGEGDRIEWWHEANTGFDSRQPLSELT